MDTGTTSDVNINDCVMCENGGACVDQIYNCAEGYTGDRCKTEYLSEWWNMYCS